MKECKICGKQFISVYKHITAHKINMFEYLKQYYYFDVIFLYNTKWSLRKLERELYKNFNYVTTRKKIKIFLLKNDCKIRGTKEATQNWADQTTVWNKNLTKNDHESILRYAEKRRGKNNPYFKMSEEKRKEHDKKFLEGGMKLFERGIFINRTKISKKEKIIKLILEELGYEVKIQFFCRNDKKERIEGRKYFIYDFFLPEKNLIIEYNGDYWHFNPEIYKKDEYCEHRKKFAIDIWKKDEQNKHYAISNGYKYLVIWEKELERLSTKETKRYLNEAIKNKIN